MCFFILQGCFRVGILILGLLALVDVLHLPYRGYATGPMVCRNVERLPAGAGEMQRNLSKVRTFTRSLLKLRTKGRKIGGNQYTGGFYNGRKIQPPMASSMGQATPENIRHEAHIEAGTPGAHRMRSHRHNALQTGAESSIAMGARQRSGQTAAGQTDDILLLMNAPRLHSRPPIVSHGARVIQSGRAALALV